MRHERLCQSGRGSRCVPAGLPGIAGGASGQPRLSAIEQFALADQVRRASKSICANLAEGFGRQQQSKPEFRRFLMMSIGSADEMQVWVLYCRDLGYVDEVTAERWRGEYREIARMLSGLHASSSDN